MAFNLISSIDFVAIQFVSTQIGNTNDLNVSLNVTTGQQHIHTQKRNKNTQRTYINIMRIQVENKERISNIGKQGVFNNGQ